MLFTACCAFVFKPSLNSYLVSIGNALRLSNQCFGISKTYQWTAPKSSKIILKCKCTSWRHSFNYHRMAPSYSETQWIVEEQYMWNRFGFKATYFNTTMWNLITVDKLVLRLTNFNTIAKENSRSLFQFWRSLTWFTFGLRLCDSKQVSEHERRHRNIIGECSVSN